MEVKEGSPPKLSFGVLKSKEERMRTLMKFF